MDNKYLLTQSKVLDERDDGPLKKYSIPAINENYMQFFTAVCTEWLPLLDSDECKNVITEALKGRVQTKQVGISGFVIMPNHLHIIWRMAAENQKRRFSKRFFEDYRQTDH